MNQLIYLAGPVRHVEKQNENQFRFYEKKLIDMGFKVIVPLDQFTPEEQKTFTQEQFMHRLLPKLLSSDKVVCLPDSFYSRGTNDEIRTAWCTGIPVIPVSRIIKERYEDSLAQY